jgi:hypothetical protein
MQFVASGRTWISGAGTAGCPPAFTYKGKPNNVKQIGRELNVRYVLEGSVQRGGNRMRVNVQLIDAETGNHLWAERFDKPSRSLRHVGRNRRAAGAVRSAGNDAAHVGLILNNAPASVALHLIARGLPKTYRRCSLKHRGGRAMAMRSKAAHSASASKPFFKCPHCSALYHIIKVEAGLESDDRQITCGTCGGPLRAREGKFVFKYFLLRHVGRRQKWKRIALFY